MEFLGGLEVQDLILPLLWLGIDPRSSNFHMLHAARKFKKKKIKAHGLFCHRAVILEPTKASMARSQLTELFQLSQNSVISGIFCAPQVLT